MSEWIGFAHSFTIRFPSNKHRKGLLDMSNESTKNHNSKEAQMATKLLNSQGEQICIKLAAGKAPWSQRAQALMAINEGASETVASERSGLRPTQVKYWLNKYQKQGMAIFPEPLLQEMDKPANTSAESNPSEDLLTVAEASQEKISKKAKQAKDKNKDKKKKNKGKQGKRSKKAKKAKGKGDKPKKEKKK
jgi:hypothetical protein